MTGTSGRQRAQKEAFDQLEMPVPSRSLLEAFETFAAPLFAAQRNATLESLCLTQARDSLLPYLLLGGNRARGG